MDADRRFQCLVALWLIVFAAFPALASDPPPYRDFSQAGAGFHGPGREDPVPDGLTSVRLGLIGPAATPEGNALRAAVELAVSEANARGGYGGLPYEVVFRADDGPWGMGAKQAAALAYEDSVWVILGGLEGGDAHVAELVAAKVWVPVITPTAADMTIDYANVPWVFRCFPSDDRQARALARWAHERGHDRLFIFYEGDREGETGLRRLTKAVPGAGLSISGQREYESPIPQAAVRADEFATADAVVVWGRAESGLALLRALRAAGFGGPVLAPSRLLSTELTAEAPRLGDLVIAAPYDLSREDARIGEFRRRYRQATGRTADHVALFAYDAARLAISAIDEAGLNHARIRDRLAGLSQAGLAGTYRFDGLGGASLEPVLMTWRDGAWAAAAPARPFIDITDQAGVRHLHHKPIMDEKLNRIMAWMASVGAAVAAADYDSDGDIDLYATSSQIATPNRLFRNEGDGTFVDVAAAAGVARANDEPFLFSIGAAFRDDLDHRNLSDSLRRALAGGGITLSPEGKISVVEAGATWRLVDPGQLYTIRATEGALAIHENRGTSMDAVWGDYDNDGHRDLYVVKWGWNILYRANGDGTFTDVTDQAGVGDRGNGNAAVWFDYNDDGWLDLYVGNYFRYVHLWSLGDAHQMHEDFETARDGGPNVLYRNNGDGTFSEVASELGVDDTGWTLDTGVGDYDNDGDLDLVNANDFGQDRVFRVNADGTFTNVTDQTIGWDTNKGMNVDFGDYNNDGWLDLYITNIWTKEYVQEGNQLYRGMGDGTFSDVSFETNVYDGGWCWAGRFWDYDNDGDLDLMVANGYISGEKGQEYFTDLAIEVTKPGFNPRDAQMWPELGGKTFAGYEPSRVWRNEGNESFTEVAAELGLADIGDGRGLAIADFDNDGDLDVYISNQGQESVLYRNDVGNQKNWLQVELTGTNCNRDAIGSRVTIVSGDLSQIRELDGGNGDHSQCPHRLHFGLADHESIDYLEIRWPTGYVERHENLAPNQLLRFTESTPGAFLEERQRFKEAEIEARRLEAGREAEAARSPTATATPSEMEPELDWNELADFKKEYLRLKQATAQDPENPRTRYEFAVVLDERGRQEAALAELERAIELDPGSLVYSNTYRTLIRRYGHIHFDRSIRFFENLVEKHPDLIMPRLNKALSYVDKMPYPKLGIVSQGKLSNRSLAELDVILGELDSECWTAKYIRGMNHLHWPRKLGHAPLAIKDFSELIALQKALPPEKQRDYFALGYVGLGDSYVKDRDEGLEENLAKARETWAEGLRQYPDEEELRLRLEMADRSSEELIAFIKELRGLEDPVDTDLARVWVE